jgi:NADP-dependent 3-hydroxy acid dehydrogenase YdfG
VTGRDGQIRTYRGAVAVVTGGASGIGRALGEALAQRGAEVFVTDRQNDLAESVAAGIRATGGKATAVNLDVRDFPRFKTVIDDVLRTRGRLDYLFNNAGIGIGGRVHLYDVGHWDRIIDVNIRGVTNGIQAAYATMRAQGFGHIINTSSLAGFMPTPGLASYGATKHAVYGLSLSLRAEAADSGVRVSVLCPGLVRTAALDWGPHHEAVEELDPETQRALIESLRPMEPGKFAEEALKAIARNQAVIVIPGRWKLVWWLNRVSPSLGLFLARMSFRRRVALLQGAPQNPPDSTH